jgi:uncharacterized protein YbjT (DUF2867 family)
MKIVITGGAGNISKPLAEILLSEKQEVTAVSRNEKNIGGLIALGAKPALGSVEDIAFLKETFTGADVLYTMVPPNMGVTEWKKWITQIGKNYAQAIRESGVKYVVNLSSVGAHLPEGCGPVSGIHFEENELNSLPDVNLLHLRPGNFYTNLLSQIGMIKNMGIMGANFGGGQLKMVLAYPADIADVAARALLERDFSGHDIRYIASDERNTDEIASVIGKEIGKPGLAWIVFSDEDYLKGLLQAGLPEEIAANFVEMGQSIRSGQMNEEYWKNRPSRLEKTKLEDFARIFSAVYHSEPETAVH